MSNEDSDILIYVPFKKEKLNENEINWLNAFQSILEIGLNQISKQKISISNFISNESLIGKKGIAENAKVIIQLLLNNNYDQSNLLSADKLKNRKIIQIYCHPEIKEEPPKDCTIINLLDESTNKAIDLSKHIDELKNEIWLKFLDIVFEIKKAVLVAEKETTKSKGKIFIAESSTDQNFNRETIIRELEHLGFEVLPKASFPKDMIPFSEFVHGNLKQSFLSVHLIGKYYAPLLNNIDISSIELQNDLFHEVAAELKAENKIIKRLVWIPTDIKPKSEKQKLYIESFKRNIELLENTEIIQTPIEVFKTIIRNKAEEILNIKTQTKTKSEGIKNKSVYVISNEVNNKTFSDIKQELIKQKLIVLEATQKANKIDLIQEHYYNLINCDALLIDYSVENLQWLNSKLSDILKSPGFGRKKSFLAKSILINTGKSPVINLQIKDLDLISYAEKDISKRLNSFIEKINKNDT